MSDTEILIDPVQGKESAGTTTDIDKTCPFKIIIEFKSVSNQDQSCCEQLLKKWKEKYSILSDIDTTSEPSESCRRKLLQKVLDKFYQQCEEKDVTNLWFFAAATCNSAKLSEIAENCERKLLCQLRCSDSALVFLLKYGDVSDENFTKCVEILLSAGINVNQPDFTGRTAFDIISELHESCKAEAVIVQKLKSIALQFLSKGVCRELLSTKSQEFLQTLQEENKDLNLETPVKDYFHFQLFAWIGKEQVQKFQDLKIGKDVANCDNGEYTLLQFACRKSAKMHPVVKFLLKHGADPNKMTEACKYTPLEIAGKKNHEKSFQELLNNKNLEITEQMFNNFVRLRSSPMKLKLFQSLLESQKLNPNFTYDTTGNTPLHYATRFSHKKAIQKLLKRCPESLVQKNKIGKTVLYMIHVEDLESYFDSCLVSDNYTTDTNADDYKMLLRFRSLINVTGDENDEVGVISRISKRRHLERLLAHPLVHTFIDLKWSKVVAYYRTILFLQGLLFLALSICFFRLSDSSQVEFVLCIFFTTLNCVTKLILFFEHRFWAPGKLRMLTLYEFCEVLLVVTLFGSFFSREFRAFAFIEMAVLFLLTVGYHPKIAKFSVMLKRVFNSFTKLMIFFSLLILAFAAAFHVLFESSDHKFFPSFWKSIFITHVMITGEFNIGEMNFTPNASGYILFFIFVIFVTIVIVNFWTGVAVTDIGTIEKDAEFNAFKYVITFLVFVQKKIYTKQYMRRFLPCPYLFPNMSDKYEVDFYINKENHQFEGRRNFPTSLGKDCLEKIKNIHRRRDNTSDEILVKLQEIMSMLKETDARTTIGQNLSHSGGETSKGTSSKETKRNKN